MTNAAAAIDTTPETPEPVKTVNPYRVYECKLPNGEAISKRHRTTEYAYVVGCYKANLENPKERDLHIFRWTGSERTAKRDRTLLEKHEDVLETFICTDIKFTGMEAAAAPSTPRKKKAASKDEAPTGDVTPDEIDEEPDFAAPEAEAFRTKKMASTAAKLVGFRAKDVAKTEAGWVVSPPE